MKSGIYCIRNIENNKRYIGRTVNLSKRKSEHFWMLNSNRHFNKYLQNAYNLHPNYFVFEIIEECENELCNEKEIFYISKYQTMDAEFGYNLCEGGKTTTGYKFTEETKRKLSEQRKGIKPTQETIEKRKATLKKHMEDDPEFAERLKEQHRKNLLGKPSWNKGRKCPDWMKKYLSEKMKGRYVSEEHKNKLRELYSGEKSLTVKTTESEVIQMRLRFLKGEKRMEIAKDFPYLHPNTVYDIIKGKRWKHIPNTIGELEKML